MFTAPCQKLQMRLRRAQSSSSSNQREKPPAAAPCDSTGFYPLVNVRVAPRDGARVRGGDVTSPKTRQHQAKTATPPPIPPPAMPLTVLLFIPPNSANQRRQSSKPFMGIWLKPPQLSPNATRARLAFFLAAARRAPVPAAGR